MPGEHFHVFLSHNREDAQAVEVIAQRLEQEGIHPWLDKWNLIPGIPWQEALESALRDCDTCAVFIGPSGLSPWQNEEMRSAIDWRVRAKNGFRLIPVLLPGAEGERPELLPDFLSRTTWIDFRRTIDDSNEFYRLKCGIRGIEPGPAPGPAVRSRQCPYRGLQFFDVPDAPHYFGRESQISWMVDQLRGPSARNQFGRFLAVVGCSGSGKSSLARAGLIAALQNNAIDGSASWPWLELRPRRNPLQSLASAVARSLGNEKDLDSVLGFAERLAHDETAFDVACGVLAPESSANRRVVVLVDQFEECFTICADGGQREMFFKNLLSASNTTGGKAIVVITLRADFYGECARYPKLAAAVSESQVLLGPMTDAELRRAIERPARIERREFEPGLVDRLMQEVQGYPGRLPLLQYALRELWDRPDGYKLTHAALAEIGGVYGALGRRAGQIYNELSESDRAICRRIFMTLVQPFEEAKYTKRRASFLELVSGTAPESDVQRVVERLAAEDARLVILESGTNEHPDRYLELAHEAVIQSWDLFRGWLDEDREFQLWHKRIRAALEDWLQTSKDRGALLDGVMLDEAAKWKEQRGGELSREERQFIEESFAERERSRREEALRREQLEQERQSRLEAERTRASNLKKFAIALAATLALALFAAGFAYVMQRAAARDFRMASSREMASGALSNLSPSDMALPVWLALNAVGRMPTREALQALHSAVQFAGGAALLGHEGAVNAMTFSADGALVATGGEDRTARIWEANPPYRELRPELVHPDRVLAVAFRPGNKQLATAGADKIARIWDLPARKQMLALPAQKDVVTSVSFSADGKSLLTASWDGTVQTWDADSGAAGRVFAHGGALPQEAAYSPDGKRVAAAFNNGAVRVWDAASGVESPPISPGKSALKALAFSPDSKLLAVAAADGTANLLQLDGPSRGLRIMGDSDGLTSVAFSPDGKWLATAGNSSAGRLWDASSAEEKIVLFGAQKALTAAAFSPRRDSRVAFASQDGSVRVYLLDTGLLVARARQILAASRRTFTAEECERYLHERCPAAP